MKKQHIVNSDNYYIIDIEENGDLALKVIVDAEVLEFDGKNGNLMDASDFESHFDEEEIQMTLDEFIYGATGFLVDWGVDEEAAKAIVEDITPWFKETMHI